MENLAYQEEYKEEILNGEIVLMSPSPTVNHNRIVINLSRIFSNFLRGKQCEAFSRRRRPLSFRKRPCHP